MISMDLKNSLKTTRKRTKQSANQFGVYDSVTWQVRNSWKKTHESCDNPTTDPTQNFNVTFAYRVLDFDNRFTSIEDHSDLLLFFYSIYNTDDDNKSSIECC